MRLIPTSDAAPRRRQGGFSLPEVALSIGIVAALVLPALALLTSGAHLATQSGDLDLSSRIARDSLGRIQIVADDGVFEFAIENGKDAVPLSVPLPPMNGTSEGFASFGAAGEPIRPLQPEEFSRGLPPEEGAVYLLSLQLEEVSRPEGGDMAEPTPLYQVSFEVEYPATASAGARDRQRFSTRLAAP